MTIPPAFALATTLGPMLVPIAAWCVLASLELIAIRGAFRPGRPLGSDLAVLTRDRLTRGVLASGLWTPRSLGIVAAMRLAAGLGLPFAGGTTVVLLLVVILATTALLGIATGGSDGADKMAIVACVAAVLIAVGQLLDDRWLCVAGIAWGGGQATIAYCTSGAAKLVRPFWRNGTALAAAMTSYRSGHAIAAMVVRHRAAATGIAWSVMLIEAVFPLALLAPPTICLAMLAILAAFHVATALVMGLNTYPWAFIATYPCIMAANTIIGGTWAT